MSDPEKVTYRVRELVVATGLSRSTIWSLIKRGELPSFKLHGARLILKSDVDAWLARAVERDRSG